MNRLLRTDGQGNWFETSYQCPEPGAMDIKVQSRLTGICRSDIDMANGLFPLLPEHMSGHEGLAEVISVGAGVSDVKPGDFVATRGEPAYADLYVAKHQEYVRVPEVHPKYIIEPVACGINVVMQAQEAIEQRAGPDAKLLILGSGFLAWVAYNFLVKQQWEFSIDVVGSSNRDLWGDKLMSEPQGDYDVVIDLSGHDWVFTKNILRNSCLVVFGAQKSVTTDFSNLLWKACTMIFPSPRNSSFYHWMIHAVQDIQNGDLDIDRFWTRAYNRNTEWQQAFQDSNQRALGFGRAYLEW